MSDQKYVLDTNVLIHNYRSIRQYKNIILPICVLEELDNLKTQNGDVGFNARKAIKEIKKSDNIQIICKDIYNESVDGWDNSKPDNKIIFCAMQNKAILVSNDINVRVKARSVGLIAEEYNRKEEVYTGVKQLSGDTDFITDFYDKAEKGINEYGLLQNQYIILTNTDIDEIYEHRWDDGKLERLKLPSYRGIPKHKQVKGMNPLQRCALDLMNNQDIPIKLILGGYGSGKSFMSVRMALYFLQSKGVYSKILCLREPVGEGKEIGYLKGTKDDKTAEFFKPIEHSLDGGEIEIEQMIRDGSLLRNIPYFIKGCTFNDTIILVDEAEDIHYKQLKLIGTRLGQNSCVYFIGDYKQSIYDVSETNGLVKLAEKLKGNPSVGVITLCEDVRSPASKIFADLD